MIMEYLREQGHSFNISGHIGYSCKKQNPLNSNVLGALAYSGNRFCAQWLFYKYPTEINVEFKTEERKRIGTTTGFVKEFSGYTPLMLAVTLGEQNFEFVRTLIEVAKSCVNEVDYQGNTLLHLAVKYNSLSIVKYLLGLKRIDPFARNSKGETAASLAKCCDFKEIYAVFSSCNDESGLKVRQYHINVID
eukprot:TRINITY_DN5912_c0_g1_i1.p1 TRINITY_DN5912_c0_g1~~TRINITY_DN5912_c0_g1_i1.p1  ORF type:complete len:191 (-),score=27.02 TRINITY_DN5912_c0_g1_i1:134-706(-)